MDNNLNIENKVVAKYFKNENYFAIKSFNDDYEKGIKVKIIECPSETKDTFILEGLLNIKLSEHIFLYYPRLKWKYNGMIINILDESLGLVEMAVFDILFLSSWYVATEKEREEPLYAYIFLKNFVLFEKKNIKEYKIYMINWISFIFNTFYLLTKDVSSIELYEVVQVNIKQLTTGLDMNFFGEVIKIRKKDEGFWKIEIKAYGGLEILTGCYIIYFELENLSNIKATVITAKSKIFFY